MRNLKVALLSVGILGIGLFFLCYCLSLGSDDAARTHQTINTFHDALVRRDELALKRSLAPSILLKSSLENSTVSRDDLAARLAETTKNITSLEAGYDFSWRQRKSVKYFCRVISKASFSSPNDNREEEIEHIDLYTYTLDHIEDEWVISKIEHW